MYSVIIEVRVTIELNIMTKGKVLVKLPSKTEFLSASIIEQSVKIILRLFSQL